MGTNPVAHNAAAPDRATVGVGLENVPPHMSEFLHEKRDRDEPVRKELREAGVGKLYVEERLKLAKLGDAYVQ